VTVFGGIRADSFSLRFGNVTGEQPYYSKALVVHVKHNLRGFGHPLVEKFYEHMNHELLRRVVVVVQDHLEAAWLLGGRALDYAEVVFVLGGLPGFA
jgi:hypothetical protein